MRKLIATVTLMALTSACAATNFEPPVGGSDLSFDQQAARCRIFARSGEQGYFAMGSQAYVAGAALGNAIGNAIRVAQNYKDCMLASGWREVREVPKGKG